MIRLVAVGKVREKFVQQGVCEYEKRLGAFGGIKVAEVRDSSPEEEAEKILKAAGGDYVVALAIDGKQFSSEEFAALLKKDIDRNICFVIGGPEGLSGKVLERADLSLSLSKMTLTHEMARLLLMEQIYRGHMINSGRQYHR